MFRASCWWNSWYCGGSGMVKVSYWNVLSALSRWAKVKFTLPGPGYHGESATKMLLEMRELKMAPLFPDHRHKMGPLVTGFWSLWSRCTRLSQFWNPITVKFSCNRKVMIDECSERMAAWEYGPPKSAFENANFLAVISQRSLLLRGSRAEPRYSLNRPNRHAGVRYWGDWKIIHEQIVKLRTQASYLFGFCWSGWKLWHWVIAFCDVLMVPIWGETWCKRRWRTKLGS